MSGQMVKQLRELWQMPSDAFADFCGLSPVTLWRIETGKIPLSKKHVSKIAKSGLFYQCCEYLIEDYILYDIGKCLYSYSCGNSCLRPREGHYRDVVEVTRRGYVFVSQEKGRQYLVAPERVQNCLAIRESKVGDFVVTVETGEQKLILTRSHLTYDYIKLLSNKFNSQTRLGSG